MQEQNKKNHKSDAIIKQLCYIFAAAFCILTTLACSHLYLIASPQKLEFDFCSNKPLIIEALYTSEASANFSDERAVALEAPASSQYIKLSFDIPSKTVQRLRINLGESPGTISIRNIILKSDTSTINFSSKFSCHDVDKHTWDNRTITIESQQKTPHIIYEDTFCANATPHHIDWYFLLITLSLSALISAAIAQCAFKYFRRKQVEHEENMKPSIGLIIIFFILLFLPWTNISTENISLSENRRLAPFPRFLHENGGINTSFGKQFDSWLQDHAAFRSELTTAYFNIKARLSAARETARLIMYSNNWMFFKQYHEAAVTPFTQEELTKVSSNLERLQTWCKNNGTHLYILACPTKEVLYADLNKSASKEEMVAVEQLRDHLKKKLPDLNFIYPLTAMKKARETTPEELLHYKSDTHQTSDGAYLMYEETMYAIRRDFPDIPLTQKQGPHIKHVRNNMVLKRDRPNDYIYYEGDLYNNLHLDDVGVLDTNYNHYECCSPDATCTPGQEPLEFHFSYTPGKYTAMLLGDSYSSYQQLWFRYSFNKMWRVRANNGVNGGKMRMQRWENKLSENPPDVLILCICAGRLYLHLSSLYD